MKYIVGLGNPGAEYKETRHNVGFIILDAVHKAGDFSDWKYKKDMNAEVATGVLDGKKITLIKPNTYMNLSGSSLRSLVKSKKDAEKILVIHDDLDLAVGAVRIKHGGGHGGHNGLQDIIRHVGADFYRIRIGIGHPGDKTQVANYVLHEPSAVEKKDLDFAIAHTIPYFADIIAGNMSAVMNELHRR